MRRCPRAVSGRRRSGWPLCANACASPASPWRTTRILIARSGAYGPGFRRPVLDARARKYAGEHAAFARLALHPQPGAMPLQHVLDDGETQPGTAAGSRAVLVDAIKALGDARDVLRLDATTMILNDKIGALHIRMPAQDDITTGRRIADGVADRLRKALYNSFALPLSHTDASLC